MAQSASSSEILAHWQYQPEEWRRFVNYELEPQLKTYRSYRNAFFIIISLAVLLMISLVLIPYMMLKPWESIWRSDVFGPVFGVAFVAGILLFVIGIYFLISRNKIASLKSSSGDVRITLTGVGINGIWLNWNYENFGWQFHNVRRKSVNLDNGGKIEILEFKCSAIHNGDFRNARGKVKTERVPIPSGKEPEAENVIRRLESEKACFGAKYK